jgi:flavorubredoxin
MMARVGSVIDPADVDILISNHAEMDHSGCLPRVAAVTKPESILASKMGVEALGAHYHRGLDITAVSDGETLSLGDTTVTFLETRMVHWPDSMFSYLSGDNVLISQDAFGLHLASIERYVDELPREIVDYEAAKYYANIVLPFSAVVKKLLARLAQLNLPIDLIACDHGPVWRRPEDISGIIGQYGHWAEQKPTRRAVVVYDTMWGSTAMMARAIGEGLAAGGAQPKLLPLSGNHRSDVATELIDAGALVVGSPTLNQTLFPTVSDALTYIRSLGVKNLVGGYFGSHGWSGQGADHVAEALRTMGIPLVGEGVKVKYVPDEDALRRCYDYGEAVAAELMAKLEAAAHEEAPAA